MKSNTKLNKKKCFKTLGQYFHTNEFHLFLFLFLSLLQLLAQIKSGLQFFLHIFSLSWFTYTFHQPVYNLMSFLFLNLAKPLTHPSLMSYLSYILHFKSQVSLRSDHNQFLFVKLTWIPLWLPSVIEEILFFLVCFLFFPGLVSVSVSAVAARDKNIWESCKLF